MKSKTIIISVISALILFTLISSVQACSCIYLPDVSTKANNSDYVFSGEVIDVRLVNSSYSQYEKDYEVTVKIIDYWKPKEFPESVNLIVRTSESSASCGYLFEKGKKYIIYANKMGQTENLGTGLCAGNSLLEDAQEDIIKLNEIKSQIPESGDKSNVFTRLFNWLKNLFS